MCNFIYLVLPKSVDASGIRRIAALHHRALDHVEDHVAYRILLCDEALFRTTHKGACDCGTCLGSAIDEREESHVYQAEIAKLGKKGWSSAKIERWLNEKDAAKRRSAERARSKNLSHLTEAEKWLEFLNQCLVHTKPNAVGLLLTWEGGSTRDLRQGERGKAIRIANVSPSFLLHLEHNRLYEIRP